MFVVLLMFLEVFDVVEVSVVVEVTDAVVEVSVTVVRLTVDEVAVVAVKVVVIVLAVEVVRVVKVVLDLVVVELVAEVAVEVELVTELAVEVLEVTELTVTVSAASYGKQHSVSLHWPLSRNSVHGIVAASGCGSHLPSMSHVTLSHILGGSQHCRGLQSLLMHGVVAAS
jgi:hypothetical protein